MYAIVKIHLTKFSDIQDDVDFTKKLLQEENVFVLPGQAFHYPGVFRVVYCSSSHVLQEASRRIANFCQRHSSGAAAM
jgi:tyrosine aminotransferase